MSTRRCMPGPRGAFTRSTRNAKAAKATGSFLERVFHKLMLNFTWWVNRKDAEGMNIFQGGFLGLDNIGVFDRSAPLPTGGLHRAVRRHRLDGHVQPEPAGHRAGTGAQKIPAYEDVASKFWEHFLYIADAMTTAARTAMGTVGRRGRIFLRCPALAGRHAHSDEAPLDGGADPAIRRGDAGTARRSMASPGFQAAA